MSKINNKVKGFLLGAATIPALGLAAHMGGYLCDGVCGDDYNLAHRFETAYSFNVPAEHRTYTVKHFDACPGERYRAAGRTKKEYLASPYLMWPLTAGLAAFGLMAGLVKDLEERRKFSIPNGRGQR